MTKKIRLYEDGRQVDEYELTDHEYYEVRAPGGALIAEIGGDDE